MRRGLNIPYSLDMMLIACRADFGATPVVVCSRIFSNAERQRRELPERASEIRGPTTILTLRARLKTGFRRVPRDARRHDVTHAQIRDRCCGTYCNHPGSAAHRFALRSIRGTTGRPLAFSTVSRGRLSLPGDLFVFRNHFSAVVSPPDSRIGGTSWEKRHICAVKCWTSPKFSTEYPTSTE
jgi:hypothetical protein